MLFWVLNNVIWQVQMLVDPRDSFEYSPAINIASERETPSNV